MHGKKRRVAKSRIKDKPPGLIESYELLPIDNNNGPKYGCNLLEYYIGQVFDCYLLIIVINGPKYSQIIMNDFIGKLLSLLLVNNEPKY